MKGKKFGGRQKGTPNKATLARAEAVATNLQKTGQTAALDKLRELARYHESIAAKFQPKFAVMLDKDKKPVLDKDGKEVYEQIGGDDSKSIEHLDHVERLYIAVLPYESPKLQATTIRHDTPEEPIKVQIEII